MSKRNFVQRGLHLTARSTSNHILGILSNSSVLTMILCKISCIPLSLTEFKQSSYSFSDVDWKIFSAWKVLLEDET